MRVRRLLLPALSLACTTTVLTGLAAAPAHASDYCDDDDATFPTVSGYSPSTVVVGLDPVLATFGVKASDECGIAGWTVSGRDFFAYDSNPTTTIYGFTDSDAGTSYADVSANDPAYNVTTKRFAFRLLRRSAFKHGADATPEPARKGQYVTVSGVLTRVDWDQERYVGYGNGTQRVQIQFRAKGASAYTTVRSVGVGKAGQVRAKVKVSGRTARDGYYRLSYAGNGVTSSATTTGDYVHVR